MLSCFTYDSIRDIKLYQSRKGYRFSVDSLILYNFVNLKSVRMIADLGAGSGIVGILLAKKYPNAKVTLFEVQESLIKLAKENVRQNFLDERVNVYKCDLRVLPYMPQMFNAYDLVVSNPPYRRLKSGRLNIDKEMAIARHEIKLTLSELIRCTSHILKIKGRFTIIYHPWRLSELIKELRKERLEPKRLRFVHSNISSEAKMVLLEAVKNGKVGLKVDNPFYIYNENGSYTNEMQKIYDV